MTQDQLNALTGEPKHTLACERTGCRRVVGPYFDPRNAAAAIDEHDRWQHGSK